MGLFEGEYHCISMQMGLILHHYTFADWQTSIAGHGGKWQHNQKKMKKKKI